MGSILRVLFQWEGRGDSEVLMVFDEKWVHLELSDPWSWFVLVGGDRTFSEI